MKYKFEYKTIDTTTLEGLKAAERLHTTGWKMINTALFSIQFERKVLKKSNTTVTGGFDHEQSRAEIAANRGKKIWGN